MCVCVCVSACACVRVCARVLFTLCARACMPLPLCLCVCVCDNETEEDRQAPTGWWSKGGQSQAPQAGAGQRDTDTKRHGRTLTQREEHARCWPRCSLQREAVHRTVHCSVKSTRAVGRTVHCRRQSTHAVEHAVSAHTDRLVLARMGSCGLQSRFSCTPTTRLTKRV